MFGAAAPLAAWLPRWGLWMAVRMIQTARGGMQGYPADVALHGTHAEADRALPTQICGGHAGWMCPHCSLQGDHHWSRATGCSCLKGTSRAISGGQAPRGDSATDPPVAARRCSTGSKLAIHGRSGFARVQEEGTTLLEQHKGTAAQWQRQRAAAWELDHTLPGDRAANQLVLL